MNQPACQIMRLGPDDLPAMRQMLEVHARAFDDLQRYRSNPPSDAYLRQHLAQSWVVVLAAMSAVEVVGGLVAYVLPKFEQPYSEVYLYDLAVADEHRRRGLATALIRALQAEALRQGAQAVFVQADVAPEDEPARRLYRKLGREARVLHYDLLDADR